MAVVMVAGASGFVGQKLSSSLRDRGDRVLVLVRRAPRAPHEIRWDPDEGLLDTASLEGVDAVVNLCGANIAEVPWTSRRRQVLRASRIDPTHLLSRACAKARVPVLVNASATGIYGDRGDEILEEANASGGGFLADLCVAWEHALRPAEDAGLRVVRMRMGVVLDTRGGLLPLVALATRAGLGGVLGTGTQWFSWIMRDDLVQAYLHALDHRLVSGPVLAVAPGTCRQRDFARILGKTLRRPVFLRYPQGLVSFGLGERGRELLLYSQRCRPAVLAASGFSWKHPDLAPALQKLF